MNPTSTDLPDTAAESGIFPVDQPVVYKRILLKISGEALMGDRESGFSPEVLDALAKEICLLHGMNVEVAIMVGGGNIFRGMQGSDKLGMDRSTADQMGMLATLMNALALQDRLEKEELFVRVMSGIEVRDICEPFIVRRARRHLEKGRIVIFGAGIGRPFFTTDTAAALRALEIKADALLKASKEDAIFDSDPRKNPGATRLKNISYQDYLTMDLKAMDLTAIALTKDYHIPIIFFNMHQYGNMIRAVTGHAPGTTIG